LPAIINEEAFDDLDGPIVRIAGARFGDSILFRLRKNITYRRWKTLSEKARNSKRIDS